MVKRGSLFTCKSPERISTRPSLETSEDLSSFYLLLNLRSSLINYDLDKTLRCTDGVETTRRNRRKISTHRRKNSHDTSMVGVTDLCRS